MARNWIGHPIKSAEDAYSTHKAKKLARSAPELGPYTPRTSMGRAAAKRGADAQSNLTTKANTEYGMGVGMMGMGAAALPSLGPILGPIGAAAGVGGGMVMLHQGAKDAQAATSAGRMGQAKAMDRVIERAKGQDVGGRAGMRAPGYKPSNDPGTVPAKGKGVKSAMPMRSNFVGDNGAQTAQPAQPTSDSASYQYARNIRLMQEGGMARDGTMPKATHNAEQVAGHLEAGRMLSEAARQEASGNHAAGAALRVMAKRHSDALAQPASGHDQMHTQDYGGGMGHNLTSFDKANASFEQSHASNPTQAPAGASSNRGFGNSKTQAAAQAAKGRTFKGFKDGHDDGTQ